MIFFHLQVGIRELCILHASAEKPQTSVLVVLDETAFCFQLAFSLQQYHKRYQGLVSHHKCLVGRRCILLNPTLLSIMSVTYQLRKICRSKRPGFRLIMSPSSCAIAQQLFPPLLYAAKELYQINSLPSIPRSLGSWWTRLRPSGTSSSTTSSAWPMS